MLKHIAGQKQHVVLSIIALLTSLTIYSTPITLNGPSSDWFVIMEGEKFDPGNDVQAQADVDLVGRGPIPTDGSSPEVVGGLYYQFDDNATPAILTDDEIAFRVRADDNVFKNGTGPYDGTIWIGMDVDADNDLDVFIQVKGNGKAGQSTLSVYEAGNGANTSPSTTTIGNGSTLLTFTDNVDLLIDTTLNIDGALAGGTPLGDVDQDGVPDQFVNFRVNFNDLANLINAYPLVDGTDTADNPLIGTLNGGAGFTKDQPVQYTIATSTNDNSFNSDVGGYDGRADDDVSFAEQGAFSPVIVYGNFSPNIVSDGGGDVAAINVISGQAEVTKVVATDADGDNITYSLAPESDYLLFDIDPLTGELSFKNPPAYNIGGNNEYVVKVIATDDATNSGSDEQEITITVLDGSVNLGGITYGQTLADSTVTSIVNDANGNPIPGTWTFDAPLTTPSVSDSNSTLYGLTFTPDDKKISPIHVMKPITIAPATLTVSAIANSKTYGDLDPTLAYSASGFVLGDTVADLTGSLSRDSGEDSGVYTINQGTLSNDNYTIEYPPADFTINKGTVTLSDIVATKITEGQTLGDALLSGVAEGVALTNVPGTWSFTDPSIVPTVADSGVTTFEITFTSDDLVNYDPVTALVTLEVESVTPVIGLNIDLSDSTLSFTVEEEIDVDYYEIYDFDTNEMIGKLMAGEGDYQLELPADVYQVIVKVVDKRGSSQNFFSDNNQTITTQYELQQGWNLISIPGDNGDVSELNALSTSGLWIWKDGMYTVTNKINAGEAFWVNVEQERTITISSEKSTKVLKLQTGWNLVGVVSNQRVPEEAMIVYSWKNIYTAIANEDDVLLQGVGYWIFSF